MSSLLQSLRTAASGAVAGSLGRPVGPPPDEDPAYTEPLGDPGLIGPDGPAWIVHGDFPAMIVGGIASLFLQALHPGAMAGVHDHSDYTNDPTGRLQRTARFVSITTYGSTPAALRAIEVVRAVHARVVGTRPDGLPYAANDPDLLRWVHVAEVWCFLRSYVRFGPRHLSSADQDRYFADIAVVAELLGATNVPKSLTAATGYLESMRSELTCSYQTEEVKRFLLQGQPDDPVTRAAYQLIVQTSVGVLPRWARDMLGLRAPAGLHLGAIRPALGVLFPTLRFALGEPIVVSTARARASAGTARARASAGTARARASAAGPTV